MRELLAKALFSHPILAHWAPDAVCRRLIAAQFAEIVLQAIYQPTDDMVLGAVACLERSRRDKILVTRVWKTMILSGLGRNAEAMAKMMDCDHYEYLRNRVDLEEKGNSNRSQAAVSSASTWVRRRRSAAD